MKRIFAATVALAILAVFLSSAQAVIKIEVAEVQNGLAFIKGNGAQLGAQITWEGGWVTTANNRNGGFSFFGVLPADCLGERSDGNETGDVQVLDCIPTNAALAPVPQTGQTTSYATGDDGAIRAGVALHRPRFIDNDNGTITDNLTGLIWLKNANCPAAGRPWATALADVASLNTDGTMNGRNCGDTSNAGGHQTDWRLPNIRELFSLIDFAFFNPALSNTAGTGQGTLTDPFSDLALQFYWSSTTFANGAAFAWAVNLYFTGNMPPNFYDKTANFMVIAVRGGP